MILSYIRFDGAQVIQNYIYQLDAIVFALILMLFVILYFGAYDNQRELQNRLFNMLSISVICMLLLEIPYIICNGKPQLIWLNQLANTLYHLLQSIPLVVYALFIGSLLGSTKKQFKTALLRWLPYLAITMGLPLINLFIPLFYTINTNGYFQRQMLLPILFFIQYIPLLFVLYTLIHKRSRIDPSLYISLWFVPVPAVMASMFQLLIPGLTLMWPFISLGIVILGLALQHKRLTEDYLTGAYNRQHLDAYLHQKLRNCKPNKTFSTFLIDVDNFKRINDEFGHKTGDEALIESVRIFKSSVRSSDFVGRYAGDEFVIVFDTNDQTTLDNLAVRIHQTADRFNASAGKFYTLTFSIGMGRFDPLVDKTIDNFIKRIDQDMYIVKRRKKTSQYMYDNRSLRR